MTKSDVSEAAAELAKMRRSLAAWLRFRTTNDKVLAGTHRTRVPLAFAQRTILGHRDLAVEQDLADKLSALLGELMPSAQLPNPDLSRNPNAAVQLATIALAGASPMAPASSSSLGGLGAGSPPWLWPVLIVGGLLLAITTAIKTAADVAKDQEEKACIQSGACTDFGFWLKIGGVAMLAYVAWNSGLGGVVKRRLGGGR
jgi:hypothetical protein